MATRDFDAMLAEKAGTPQTFRVAGQDFTLRQKLPQAKWFSLMALMRDESADQRAATEEFFKAVLIKADRPRFLALLEREGDDDEDDSNVIGMDQANAITDWALEYFSGKLPSNSTGSSPGVNATGQQPNVVSLQSKQVANAS
jgi:hypothetical protein